MPRWGSRVVIPFGSLALFAGFAALWVCGLKGAYFDILGFLGVDPFRFPFVDTHALLSAAECHHAGIDVYQQNPCDALHRPHAFTPLWLSLIPPVLGTGDTWWVGLALDLAFILSLAALFDAGSRRELIVAALVVWSPTTLYAVERANNDLVIFLLILAGSLLGVASRRSRLVSYLFLLLAGLLKYYPLALLISLGRERWRTVWLPAIGAAVGLLLFVAYCNTEIVKALANVPAGSYLDEGFRAFSLPSLSRVWPWRYSTRIATASMIRETESRSALSSFSISWKRSKRGRT